MGESYWSAVRRMHAGSWFSKGAKSSLCAAALLTGSLVSVQPGQADMIGVQFFKGNFQVDAIDMATGAQTAIGTTGIDRLNSLAATPAGELYSIGGPSTTNQSHLVRINPLTGAGTDLGTLNFDSVPSPTATSYSLTGLAADASGMLYGVLNTFNGPTTQALYRINPSTLQATQLSTALGVGSIVGLDFSPTGALYGVANSSGNQGLVTIDTTTWQATRVSQPPDFPWAIQSIAFDNDGTLYGISSSMGNPGGSGRIYTIDPLTGIATLTFGSGLSNDFRGIEFLPAPVPVPAAVWLFGSGIAAMAGLARRRATA